MLISETLEQIANELKSKNKKVQLIYAFNGTGKTRLSKEFQKLICKKKTTKKIDEEQKRKFLYYSAYTEDLFYWDNDIENNEEPKLKIQGNDFTNWILKVQGKEGAIVKNFQYYINNDKLVPKFNEEYKIKNQENKDIVIPAYSEVTFSLQKGDDTNSGNIKISKGEESLFIWCVFYSIFEQVIEELNEIEERESDQFNDLEYIFIDDPVTSLDENHLIELAVDLAKLIKSSESDLKFIITTHNPLFYNVLYSELDRKNGYLITKNDNNLYDLKLKKGDSNCSFSYHLYIRDLLKEAIENNNLQKFHFTLLRNLYEKTACFLGYPRWSELLPDNKITYYNKIIQFSSHSTLSGITVAEPTDQEKKIISFLFKDLVNKYNYWTQEESNAE